ncbi:hypothetical protein MN202_13030 [Rheinheimera muenzenbergensis]|uniref:Uncharacterized protein n=1 Tax=Rheinheimera muenzenbergensis TaxID=1193628 RepID=A0ABU8C882_9GAMM
MSAVKQSHIQQQRFFFQQQKTVDLSQQELKALSLVWTDETAPKSQAGRREAETAHCAVLGYN